MPQNGAQGTISVAPQAAPQPTTPQTTKPAVAQSFANGAQQPQTTTQPAQSAKPQTPSP